MFLEFGFGGRHENGNRLFTLLDLNQVIVTNVRFQHPDRHLVE